MFSVRYNEGIERLIFFDGDEMRYPHAFPSLFSSLLHLCRMLAKFPNDGGRLTKGEIKYDNTAPTPLAVWQMV